MQRESYRGAKARTLFETAAEVLGPSAALPGMRLVDDRGVVHTYPAVILVSNNPPDAPPSAPLGATTSLGPQGPDPATGTEVSR